jgi:Flp pilus assembly protein TadB
MKKQRKRFVLAEASLKEIDKQLNINMFVIGVLVIVLFLDLMHFIKEYSVFYGVLVAVMIVLLFFTLKSRRLLKLRKQQLSQ